MRLTGQDDGINHKRPNSDGKRQPVPPSLRTSLKAFGRQSNSVLYCDWPEAALKEQVRAAGRLDVREYRAGSGGISLSFG